MNYKIEFEEMRAMRRSLINEYIHARYFGWNFTLRTIKESVRLSEVEDYGQELKAYKDFTS